MAPLLVDLRRDEPGEEACKIEVCLFAPPSSSSLCILRILRGKDVVIKGKEEQRRVLNSKRAEGGSAQHIKGM
jgi:hypothetical protein